MLGAVGHGVDGGLRKQAVSALPGREDRTGRRAQPRTLCPARRKARSWGLKFQIMTEPSREPEMSCFMLVLKQTAVTASLWPRKARSSVGSSVYSAGQCRQPSNLAACRAAVAAPTCGISADGVMLFRPMHYC